jgi:hypothetical protein
MRTNQRSSKNLRCFVTGSLAAVCIMLVFFFLRLAGLTPVNLEAGIGTRLFAARALGTVLGFVCVVLLGGILGLVLRLTLRACNRGGILPGISLGIGFRFVSSMFVATFPSFDVLTPTWAMPVGPMGAFGGKLTFYSILLANAGFGAVIGRMVHEPKQLQQ